jgi:hypothetical protein
MPAVSRDALLVPGGRHSGTARSDELFVDRALGQGESLLLRDEPASMDGAAGLPRGALAIVPEQA